ncbi:MAG TPA: hypothetical protein VN841_02175 [Bryobacteraceae bacterium]|nr:hypothetical protein [Bryobacteraceae bacterium]
METAFDKLVRELDDDGLAGLRHAVMAELGQRRQKTSIQVEDIHPGMKEADRDRVRQEIARVLRGEE